MHWLDIDASSNMMGGPKSLAFWVMTQVAFGALGSFDVGDNAAATLDWALSTVIPASPSSFLWLDEETVSRCDCQGHKCCSHTRSNSLCHLNPHAAKHESSGAWAQICNRNFL